MKIRIAFAGLLLALSTACAQSPTAPATRTHADVITPRWEDSPLPADTAENRGGGAMGSGG
jgi:hypothetical protein